MQEQFSAPTRRRRNDPFVGGVFLVVLGCALFVAQVSPDLARYVVLAIGLGLLAVFAINRTYGALVGGSILTGVGVGIAIASTYAGDLAGAAVLLSIAAGFLAIWVVSYALQLPRRHPWPLIPAAMLGSIGLAILLGGDAEKAASYWPAVLIILGVVLIAAAALRRGNTASQS